MNPPVPPAEMGKLSKKEQYYFDSFAKGKANGDWFPHEMNLLVDLARVSAELDKLRKQLKKEGPTVPRGQDGVMSNPLIININAYAGQKLSIARSLNLASSATLKKKELTARAAKQRESADTVTSGKPRLLAVPVAKNA